MKISVQILRILIPLCILAACSKDPGSFTVNSTSGSPVSPPSPSPIAGKEFFFQDLEWNYYNSGSGSPWWDEIYVSTTARPDLFQNAQGLNYNYYLNAEVSLKLDTSADFIPVKSASNYDANLPLQYTYVIYSPQLVINIWPLHHELVGRKATVRVKFF